MNTAAINVIKTMERYFTPRCVTRKFPAHLIGSPFELKDAVFEMTFLVSLALIKFRCVVRHPNLFINTYSLTTVSPQSHHIDPHPPHLRQTPMFSLRFITDRFSVPWVACNDLSSRCKWCLHCNL